MSTWLKVRRNQLLLGVLVLAAAAGAFFFLGKGSTTGTGAIPPITGTGPTAAPSPSPSGSKGHATKTLVFNGRNPFQCIVCPPEPTPSVSPSASPSPGAIPNGVTNSAVVSSVQVGGHTVSLLGVFARQGAMKAKVQVDGSSYTVAAGNRFGSNFKLASISGSCARLLYGDTAFSLCN